MPTGLAAGDSLGWSVALSGDLAAVGSFGDGAAPDSGLVALFRYDGTTWTEEVKLAASDGAAFDSFGYSVAVDGNGRLVVVGAPNEGTPGAPEGAAYVYRTDGAVWTEEAKLVPSAPSPFGFDFFGVSVAVSGDVAVVGAPFNTTGAAYVFRYDGASWVEEQLLLASDGRAGRRLRLVGGRLRGSGADRRPVRRRSRG